MLYHYRKTEKPHKTIKSLLKPQFFPFLPPLQILFLPSNCRKSNAVSCPKFLTKNFVITVSKQSFVGTGRFGNLRLKRIRTSQRWQTRPMEWRRGCCSSERLPKSKYFLVAEHPNCCICRRKLCEDVSELFGTNSKEYASGCWVAVHCSFDSWQVLFCEKIVHLCLLCEFPRHNADKSRCRHQNKPTSKRPWIYVRKLDVTMMSWPTKKVHDPISKILSQYWILSLQIRPNFAASSPCWKGAPIPFINVAVLLSDHLRHLTPCCFQMDIRSRSW